MGLANTSVVLYQSLKIGVKWILCAVDEDSSHFSEGPFYVSWYEGKKKQMEPVGRDPELALRKTILKRTALAFIAVGGEVKKTDHAQNPVADSVQGEVRNTGLAQPRDRDQKSLRIAISQYLADCLDRQGKSGYGLAVRTPKAYEDRLAYLIEFKPDAHMDEIDADFIKLFRRFLRKHENDLSDRSCFNIMQAVSTFLNTNGIGAAKPVLREMSYPPTIVVPYPDEEMQKFFGVCNENEELIFKFFLHSMAREMEVANTEVRDLKFDRNVLHISPKPDRNFRLKGKRSGQAKNGRYVPMPADFMARLKKICAGKALRDLLFPNGEGNIEGHFLRMCKKIAKRASLPNWKEWTLHRWRKTGATKHHNGGVPVRTIQAWLGHESLEETLDYLGVADAADESSQQQVNNGALAAFV